MWDLLAIYLISIVSVALIFVYMKLTQPKEEEHKLRIGLFGGTFDPFTEAHQAIVDKVLELGLVDVVTILPTIVTYHRNGKKPWLDETLKSAVIGCFTTRSPYHGRISIDCIEMGMARRGTLTDEQIRNWRFINTIERLEADYKDTPVEFYMIIGTDSLKNLKTWHRWEDIVSKVKIIAVEGRNGETVDTDIEYTPIKIDEKYSSMSSSEIRSKFSNLSDYLKSVNKN